MERVYVCRDRNGTPFLASAELEELLDVALAAGAVSRGACRVELDTQPGAGLRVARMDGWRVVAYERGGYARQERVPTWEPTRGMPDEVEAALCFALGLAVQRPWTTEEILAREG